MDKTETRVTEGTGAVLYGGMGNPGESTYPGFVPTRSSAADDEHKAALQAACVIAGEIKRNLSF